MYTENVFISQLDAEIINYLCVCHDYCDSYDIARAVGINRRKVRSEINNVKDILNALGYTLDSKRSKGYKILERTKITSLRERVSAIVKESTMFSSPRGRQDYLIEVLVSNDHTYTKLDDLADALYVSRSTINNDLAYLSNGLLRRRNCYFETKPRYGIRLIGSETAKREMLCDCMFNVYTQNNSHNSFIDLFLVPGRKLENSIMTVLKRYDIHMSDYALCDFLIYLTVVCIRLSNGNMLESSPDISFVKEREEFDIARIIAGQIYEYLGLPFNAHETSMIGIKMIAKESSAYQKTSFDNQETLQIVNDTFEEIRQRTGIIFSNHENHQRLANYIDRTLTILRLSEKVRNPFYSVIRENYPLAYDITLIAAEMIRKHTGIQISSSHIAFYTVFFNTWIQNKRYRRRRVLLICGLGVGATDSVQKELEVALGQEIRITGKCMYYELDSMDLDEYDMIISTLPILRNMPVPVVNISQFVTSEDLTRIHSNLSADYSQFHPELLYIPSLFQSGLSADNIEDVFSQMAEPICELFTKLKYSYVANSLSSDQNIRTSLNNGFLFVKLVKPLNSVGFSTIALLSSTLKYGEDDICAVIVISTGDNEIHRALREASRAIGRKEIRALSLQKKPSYAEFIKLYHDE